MDLAARAVPFEGGEAHSGMAIGARYHLYFEVGKASSARLSVPGIAYISRVGRLTTARLSVICISRGES